MPLPENIVDLRKNVVGKPVIVFTFIGIPFRLGTANEIRLIGTENSRVVIYFNTDCGAYCLAFGDYILCSLKKNIDCQPQNSNDVLTTMLRAALQKQEWEDCVQRPPKSIDDYHRK